MSPGSTAVEDVVMVRQEEGKLDGTPNEPPRKIRVVETKKSVDPGAFPELQAIKDVISGIPEE
ncbi:unnamed protein product, partial [Strongylus vulgaris]